MALSLRAQNSLIQALSITQSQHTETLARHSVALATLQTGVDQIVGMLTQLINKGDPAA